MAKKTGLEGLRILAEARFPANEAIGWRLSGMSLGGELVQRAMTQAGLKRDSASRVQVFLDGPEFVVRFYAPVSRKPTDPGVHDLLPEFPTRLPPETARRKKSDGAAQEAPKSVFMDLDPQAIYEAFRERA